MIDLSDKKARGRVLRAIKDSREKLEPYRKVRKELLKDYVGSWYSEDGAENKTLVNLMNQTARIYTIALAAENPAVLVSTPRQEHLPFARRFETNLNKMIEDMKLDKTFRQIVLDAFFCIGIGVTMMRDSGTKFHGMLESEEDVWLDPGEPWFNRVSLDDAILDMSAKEISKMRFCGHRFRADFEKVQSEPQYDKKVLKQLKPTTKSQSETEVRADEIGQSFEVDDDELKPMIWLQNVYIAENNSIATMACDIDLPPLLEVDWAGSQGGPYKYLSLGDVPDNIIPVSPAHNLKGMHDMQNRLHRRMEADSDAHKVVNAYPPAGADDAEKIRNAGRNDWVRVGDPNGIKTVEVGGVDQRDLALSSFIQQEYDRFAGNLQAMGGLGAQSATVGQEELIQGGVARNEADMRMAVVQFASESILDLGRLMWEDSELEIRSSMQVGNTGIEVNSDWTPDNRVGNFEDYRFRVEPYSMVFKTPDQKLAELYETLQQLAPLWPMLQPSGASLDGAAIVEEIARLKNRPEFKRFITFAAPADMLGGDQNTIRQSPVTSRETVRKNVPTGGTQENQANILQQVLMGNSSPQVNGQQAASMGRSPV